MARILKRDNMENILLGATLLGAGGGGSIEDGLKCMKTVEERRKLEVNLISPQEMEDGSYAGVIAGIGSPVVLKETSFYEEALHCYDALESASFFAGRPLKYVYSGEMGGFNTFTPMLVAIEKGLDMVDADGVGRAVPGLDVTLCNVHGIPTKPLAVASKTGDSIIAYPQNGFDGKRSEVIARNFCLGCGMIAAFGTWVVDKNEIQTMLADGMITFAEKLGEKIKSAKKNKSSLAETLNNVLPTRELCKGVITKKQLEVKDGWDWGSTEIEKEDGSKYFIDFKNENLVARDDKKVYLTAPDIITIVESDTYTPLTNSDTKEGQSVVVLAMPVHKNWFSNSKGTQVWQPYFDGINYTGKIVRFEEEVQA